MDLIAGYGSTDGSDRGGGSGSGSGSDDDAPPTTTGGGGEEGHSGGPAPMMADERQELLMAELAAAMARITPAMRELNNFHHAIERRDYKKVIKWLRTGFNDAGSKPVSGQATAATS